MYRLKGLCGVAIILGVSLLPVSGGNFGGLAELGLDNVTGLHDPMAALDGSGSQASRGADAGLQAFTSVASEAAGDPEPPSRGGDGGGDHPDCDVDADCDDGEFCNGQEFCDEGDCEGGDDPCDSEEECNEETEECCCDTPAECDGDVNGDGAVDPLDMGAILARFGEDPCEDGDCEFDVNCDNAIDPLDSGYVLARLGTCNPVPCCDLSCD